MTISIVHYLQKVTILILIDGFLQFMAIIRQVTLDKVTILILIDGFLQFLFRV